MMSTTYARGRSLNLVLAFLLPSVAALGTTAAHAASSRYEWTSQAIVAIGSRNLRAVHTGVVTATDAAEAQRRATADAEHQIQRDYPAGKLKPETLTVQARRINDEVKDEVSIRVTIACRYTQSKEEGLRIFSDDFVLISDPKEINTFYTVLTVKGPDGEQSYPRKIRSVGRGSATECYLSTNIWHGRLVDGGDPVSLSVSLTTKAEGEAPTDMGEVTITVGEAGGVLNCGWQPDRFARFIGDPQPMRGHHARFELRNGDRVYDLFASVYNPAELARIQEREDKEFVRNLNNRPDSIEVMTGSVTAKFRNRQGQTLTLGSGKTFIISHNEAAAREYAARVFPNRPDVIIVKDRDAADAALRTAWAEARRTIFKNENVLDDTVQYSLTPKVGPQMIDRISKFPPRRR